MVASAAKCILYFFSEEPMFRFRKFLPIVAALIGAAILGAPTRAHADFELRVSTTGSSGTFTTYFSIDGGASWWTGANNTGTDVGAAINADAMSITATSTDFLSVGKSTMDLGVHGTDTNKAYNLVVQSTVTSVPTAPPPQTLSWDFTSSSQLAGMTEAAHSWVDQSNQDFGGAPGGPAGSNVVANSGTLTAPAVGSTTFSATTPPGYSWTLQYTLVGTPNDGGGDQISTDDSQKIVNGPVPAGLLLALTGMPVLGLGAWVRRRRIRTEK
jgi:hypothetical protein